MPPARFEFHRFDASNLIRLLTPGGESSLETFDGLFVSTNVTSDQQSLNLLEEHAETIERFLADGNGIFVSYQKKLTFSKGSEPQELAFLPRRFRVHMMERPPTEPDSGQGDVSFAANRDCMNTGAYLLVSSPNTITPQMVRTHCLENDFKAHLYRATLRPLNSSVFESVFHDASYEDDYGNRDLFLVNRSAEYGERIVISTIAIDWEAHLRLLENILEYIAAGVPRLAFFGPSPTRNSDIDFIISTARLAGVPSREYSRLQVPSDRMRGIHDVYVVSGQWGTEAVAEFWSHVSPPRQLSFREASQFRRLYHMSDHNVQSLTRYVNYSSLDTVINEAVLWLERQFSNGYWGGGFWNSHDVLVALDVLRIDVANFIPGVLADVSKHLRQGAYDGVMGPTCGLLSLLNRLSLRYADTLDACRFGEETRTEIAAWICSNAPTQSEMARQVAAQAIFSPGGERLVSALRGSNWADEVTMLSRVVRQSNYTSSTWLSAYTNLDLSRLLEMGGAPETIDDGVRAHVYSALVARQDDSGRWGATGETATVLSSFFESEHEPGTAAYEAILKGAEAIRADFDQATKSWNENIQETASCVRALGLFNDRLDVAAQEVLETIELQRLSSNRASTVGQARLDLAALFDREERRARELVEVQSQFELQSARLVASAVTIEQSRHRSVWFKRLAVVSLSLLLGVIGSMLIAQPRALWNLVGDAGSVLGLVLGALIAVPITLWLSPKESPKDKSLKREAEEPE